MFQRYEKFAKRAVVAGTSLVVAGIASAQSTDISTLFDSIDLSSVSSKVMALGVTIVGIALVIKGPAIAKRLIRLI